MPSADFHIAMAVSIASIRTLTTTRGGTYREMCHLSKSMNLVCQRLSNDDAARDPTLAVVVMTAQYERHRGRYSQGFVHLSGLQRMVEMRGGIRFLLSENVVLGQKLIR